MKEFNTDLSSIIPDKILLRKYANSKFPSIPLGTDFLSSGINSGDIAIIWKKEINGETFFIIKIEKEKK